MGAYIGRPRTKSGLHTELSLKTIQMPQQEWLEGSERRTRTDSESTSLVMPQVFQVSTGVSRNYVSISLEGRRPKRNVFNVGFSGLRLDAAQSALTLPAPGWYRSATHDTRRLVEEITCPTCTSPYAPLGKRTTIRKRVRIKTAYSLFRLLPPLPSYPHVSLPRQHQVMLVTVDDVKNQFFDYIIVGECCHGSYLTSCMNKSLHVGGGVRIAA